MAITSTIWDLQPHTEAKHVIFKKYLDAWLPILTKHQGRVIIIDGFAGPGEYSGGEDGSPIIALNAVINHTIPIKAEVRFLFIEKNKKRYEFLKNKIEKMNLKENIKWQCLNDEFANIINSILEDIEKNNSNLAPTFTFIDPFGFSGIPMSIIKRLMNNKRCEVLITFMYDELKRFINLPTNEKNCTELFATEEWKTIINEVNPQLKERMLHQLYRTQLENFANIQFVRSFRMKNESGTCDYYLFFGTNNKLGLEKIKEAMWKVDPSGKFEFSDAAYNPEQTVLFEIQPNYTKLKNMILEEYKGKKVNGAELEDFVIIKTAFTKFHYKSSILVPMEEKGEIRVTCEGKRRPYTYPDRAIIEFL